jgi:hypothetical protein
MSYIVPKAGGLTQPITLTANIDADDFSIINATSITAGTGGFTLGTDTDSLAFYGGTPTTQNIADLVVLLGQGASYNQGDINAEFNLLGDALNTLIQQLQATGLLG